MQTGETVELTGEFAGDGARVSGRREAELLSRWPLRGLTSPAGDPPPLRAGGAGCRCAAAGGGTAELAASPCRS